MPCLSCTPKYEPGPDIANRPPILITLSCAKPSFAPANRAKLASTPMQSVAECRLMALLPKGYLFHLSPKQRRLPIAYPVASQLQVLLCTASVSEGHRPPRGEL